MPRFIPAESASVSSANYVQLFGSTSIGGTTNVVLHCSANMYFNTANSDTGKGYLGAGTYSFGPIDPSTVWIKAVSTTGTCSGYVLMQ
jgi:hypothetical protein